MLELMHNSPMEVFLMNTGRVGGPERHEGSKKVKIPHSSAIVEGIEPGTDKRPASPQRLFETCHWL